MQTARLTRTPTAAHATFRVYCAFHVGCPHRYLSRDSIQAFYDEEKRLPEFILGKIVMVSEEVANEVSATRMLVMLC